ncbi:MAG: c-type cytochrome [Planctomycetota bacterium]|nr:c-type cytochrome [Planctomycetota bacterium]
MSVSIQCECGKAYAVRDTLRGKKVKCAQCGKTIPVPLESQPAKVAASPPAPHAAAPRPPVQQTAARPATPAAPKPPPVQPQPAKVATSPPAPHAAAPRPAVQQTAARPATPAAPKPKPLPVRPQPAKAAAKPVPVRPSGDQPAAGSAVAVAPPPTAEAATERDEEPQDEDEAGPDEQEQEQEQKPQRAAARHPKKPPAARRSGNRTLMTVAVLLVVGSSIGLAAWYMMTRRGRSGEVTVASAGASSDEGRRTPEDGGGTSAVSRTGSLVTSTADRGPAGELAAGYLSPLALVADRAGKTIYVAEMTAKQVAVFDVAAGKVTTTIAMPEMPDGLALAPDGTQLYVTGAAPGGHVHAISLPDGKLSWSVPLGHTPNAPVLSADGKTLYVCNRFSDSVAAIDVAAKKVAATIRVLREPVAAVLTLDGKCLFVANLVPVGSSDGEYIAAGISVIDTAENKVVATVKLLNGSSSVRGLCISPDGKYVYGVHTLGRYQVPTTQLERGWMNTNALSVIDVAGKALVNTVLLDDVDLGAANPWGVACSADGTYLCVTHAGTHELSVIDRAALHGKLTRIAAGEKVSNVSVSAADVPNDLSFLVGLRRRLQLAGEGPRGLVIIGTKAYVAEYFTGALGVADISPDNCISAKSVSLGAQPAMSVVRKGELFFQDARLCFQKWQSCTSCHPDARADGLNWDLLNDGVGNPKNTKSMLLAHETPPVMSLGVRDTAEMAVRAGIRFIQFAVRPEEDAVAIDEYLKSLKPVPSPYLANGAPSKAAQRGQKVFEQAKCATCHSGPLFTNLKQYDLGLAKTMDKGKPFDTPTLVEVWRTAPYLHDGRAATMNDVLTKFNAEGKHGTTEKLSSEEIADLVEYVMSL